MKVLVTGSSGLLATNTIKELLNHNYSVLAQLRNKKRFLLHDHPNLDLIECDLNDHLNLSRALRSCKALIHIAAETNQNLVKYGAYEKVNVDLTQGLLDLAVENGVETFVYISSANAFAHGTREKPGNETKEWVPPFTKSHYSRSKKTAQELVLKHTDKLKVVIINPTFMIGPYDQRPSSGRIILLAYQKKLLFVPSGGKNFVHVSDVARGIRLALENGENGQSYLMSGENLTYKEFYEKLCRLTNTKSLFIQIPDFVLTMAGFIGFCMQKLGIRTAVTPANMKILCTRNFYSNQKAKDTFQMKFQDIDPAIKAALKWFYDNSLLGNYKEVNEV